MIDLSRKRRTLLIGAGRRIQNNYLPALRCMSNVFDIVGIHSRTLANLTVVADKWELRAVPDLNDAAFSDVDVVAISVPTSQNAAVLRKLAHHAPALDVVIDTPIAWSMQEHSEIAPLLARFKRVTVTEDYMNFPRFALVRQAVSHGIIGALQSISLYNIGYLYHGLALIRSFVGFAKARGAWSRRLSPSAVATGYDFDGGFSASVIGPYRRHTTGGILAEGTKGIITEFPIDKDFVANGRATHVLGKLATGGDLSGFEIRGGGYLATLDLPFMRQMRAMDIADKSDLNLERGCGLIEVFRSLVDFRNINVDYTAEDAFYDSFASRRAESQKEPLDPFVSGSLGYQEWAATTETFLKTSPEPAASLPDADKIAVSAGTRVRARSARAAGNHTAMSGVTLNGSTVPEREWFLYEAHWAAT